METVVERPAVDRGTTSKSDSPPFVRSTSDIGIGISPSQLPSTSSKAVNAEYRRRHKLDLACCQQQVKNCEDPNTKKKSTAISSSSTDRALIFGRRNTKTPFFLMTFSESTQCALSSDPRQGPTKTNDLLRSCLRLGGILAFQKRRACRGETCDEVRKLKH